MELNELPEIIVNKILAIKSNAPYLVRTKKIPIRWINVHLKRGVTSDTKIHDILHPNMEFRNPKKTNIVVKEIAIIVDKKFRTNGILKIDIDNYKAFESDDPGDFTDIVEMHVPIPEGVILEPDRCVGIFFYAPSGEEISISVSITFGDI